MPWLIALLAAVTAGGTGVSFVRAQEAAPKPNDAAFDLQWAHPLIGVQEAWKTGKGDGATVAILDTGVHFPHEDLRGRLLQGRNFVRRDRTAQDDNGQGTHLAGIVAATANNRTGVAGIAPQALILPVKVLDAEDEGTERNVLDGIAYAVERKASVLLLDLDRDIALSEGGAAFRKAIEGAFAAGVLPVLSAEHPYLLSAAFSDAPALVVAGLTRESKAPTYDHADGVGQARWGLAAPSGAGDGSENDILSTMWPHTRQPLGGPREEFGRYAYDADNIQAAAHVAGAAAILRGLGQSAQQAADRILQSATEAGPRGRDPQFGRGILAVGGSVQGLAPAPPAQGTASPPASQPPGGAATTTLPTSTTPPTGETGAAGAPTPPPEVAATAPAVPTTEPVDDVVGGLAVAGMPDEGRLPVIPIVIFLLALGTATITWALRRRTEPE